MKTTCCFPFGSCRRWVAAAVLLACTTAFSQTTSPTISSVRLDGTNISAIVRVPSGVRKVTLECRDRFGAGSWEPRAVSRLDGAGGTLTFTLPRSRPFEVMRVRGDETEPLPASFFSGTNQFYNGTAGGPGRGPGVMDAVGPGATPPGGNQSPSREVVESDIWKIRGQTLYFFNQFRGLQVIDITNPDAAVVRGTLDLPAAGEDLYLLGPNHVVLLARNGCSSDESQVVIAADNAGTPSVVARLPVKGYIVESRLVGTALYVASQALRPVAGSTNSSWEWGTLVSSFDLADPAAPAARGTLWYSGYGNVVSATDVLLFVVTQDPANWWQSIVRSIDITQPDGTMHAYESIRTAGRVPDKFKLRWAGGIFTSISEDWRSTSTRRLTTKLETFRLPDPRSAGPAGVSKLGELELGAGEQLHATRFDGDRAYVVTFFRIDPLWVVDLSNPSAPRIAGSVDVPGWSTFIQPLGGRLVTLGVETGRVAVSLFDVANAAAPALLSRVRLGENYSWSEANWDEKAFTVLEESGLILVPYTGNTTNGYASRVQLIDLNARSLAARGVIEQQFPARRATLYVNRILALSGSELLSVDATDRDHPLVRGTTPLAWPVDRVFVEGNFLLELGGSGGWGWGWWGNSGEPVVRVARAAAPNEVLAQIALTNLPIVGADVRDGKLYVAQAPQSWFGPLPLAGDGSDPAEPPRSKFLLTVIGLDELPAVNVLGQVAADVSGFGFVSDYEAVWPRPGVLVWSGGGFSFWRWFEVMPLAAGPGLLFPWFPWSGGGGQLLAFDVSQPAAPQFSSEVVLMSNNWWSFSRAFTAEGLVYLSHQTSEFVAWADASTPAGGGVVSPVGGVVSPEPIGSWVTRSYLDVVDYADGGHPLTRRPVSIPGTLQGLSHRGAVLYTVGSHWTTNSTWYWREFLDASAYDGVSAHLIDSLELSESWPHPVRVLESDVFVGRPGGAWGGVTNDVPSALETWHLSDAGRWTRSGTVTLTLPAQSIVNFGALLAAQTWDNVVTLFDATDGAALRQVGQGRPSGCLWFDLTHADGELGRGLWIPLGAYGVATVPAGPK